MDRLNEAPYTAEQIHCWTNDSLLTNHALQSQLGDLKNLKLQLLPHFSSDEVQHTSASSQHCKEQLNSTMASSSQQAAIAGSQQYMPFVVRLRPTPPPPTPSTTMPKNTFAPSTPETCREVSAVCSLLTPRWTNTSPAPCAPLLFNALWNISMV